MRYSYTWWRHDIHGNASRINSSFWWGIFPQRASDVGLWYFLCCYPESMLWIKAVAGDLTSAVTSKIRCRFYAMIIMASFHVWRDWKYKNNTEMEMWSGWLIRSHCYTRTNNCDREPRVKCLWLYLRLSHWSFCSVHDDVIKWKHFPRYWPFVRGIHRWPVNSPHKGQ